MSAPDLGPAVADLDVTVISAERRGSVCRLVLDWPAMFEGARAGQFVLVKSLRPGAPLLPRPISLVPAPESLALVFNIAGEGTRFLASAEPGEAIALIGPLGNAFAPPDEPILIVTDAPHVGTMLALALERRAAGFADDAFVYVSDPAAPHPSDAILLADFAALGLAPVATAPGELDATLARLARGYIAAGAANGVMAAAQRLAGARGLSGEASLQAPMACGIGVCQVCIHDAAHGRILVCEGPIFPLQVPRFDTGGGH